jgi:uncharacterized RDD family membrane protein YckC
MSPVQPQPYRVGGACEALARSRRELLTPEGIPISFTLASVGDRAAAFLLDMLIMIGVVLVLAFVANAALGASFERDSWLLPFVIIAVFLIVNFYFAFFEIRWQGATPGKRALKLRVIDAKGGQLESSSVLARNLMRELEVWMPARFLLGGSMLWPDAPGWSRIAATIWTLVFMLLPVFNRDKLRAGDIIGGTRVVMAPKAVLAPDLADTTVSGHALFIPPQMAVPAYAPPGTAPQVVQPARKQPMFTFTDAQLGIYGEYELQVLEGVLRDTAGAGRDQTLSVVADKIQVKIQYDPRVKFGQEERFLREFYTALRAHLEKRMLFGKRKADKFKK